MCIYLRASGDKKITFLTKIWMKMKKKQGLDKHWTKSLEIVCGRRSFTSLSLCSVLLAFHFVEAANNHRLQHENFRLFQHQGPGFVKYLINFYKRLCNQALNNVILLCKQTERLKESNLLMC